MKDYKGVDDLLAAFEPCPTSLPRILRWLANAMTRGCGHVCMPLARRGGQSVTYVLSVYLRRKCLGCSLLLMWSFSHFGESLPVEARY